jgi:protein associated with RNAse G/E
VNSFLSGRSELQKKIKVIHYSDKMQRVKTLQKYIVSWILENNNNFLKNNVLKNMGNRTQNSG